MKGKVDEEGDEICMDCLKTLDENEEPLHFFAAQMNLDADTGVTHTECSISYTFIGMPHQDQDVHLRFVFDIKLERKLWLKMDQGVVFLYSAYVLTHKQECLKK
eukprot:1035745-Ditylum_brightwellii.AAC.1